MKNVEVLMTAKSLSEIDVTGISGVKLSYAIISNSKVLGEESKNIEESKKYPEEYQKIEEEMRDLFMANALSDKKGNPIVENDTYSLDPEKVKEYNSKVKEIQDSPENKELFDKIALIDKDYLKFLEEESPLKEDKLITVTLDQLPEDITVNQMSVLSFMIKELKTE
tara:strand:+ start:241 stop:741 length:501 start_codon:yes stop_codon:yes gene_type:complete